MLVLELLFALCLVALLAGTGVVAALVWSLNRRSEAQARDLVEVRAQLAAGGQSQDAASQEVRQKLEQAQTSLEGFRSTIEARLKVEDESRQSLRRLEAIIAGSSTRGAAGENILEEAFRHLPADMVQRNVWVKGKVVEFGLRLPGGKLLPLDSKWTSSAALEELAGADCEPSRRTQLAAQVEKEVERRIREVSQYIDPATTAPFAIAAIPDGAYSVCRGVHAEAHRRQVIIVGFSMALPYLLALYQLHLQFARSVDMENLQAGLMDIDRQLDALEGVLENRLQKAITMLSNAYQEGKQVSARVRGSAQAIQRSERLVEGPAGAVLEGPELLLVEEG